VLILNRPRSTQHLNGELPAREGCKGAFAARFRSASLLRVGRGMGQRQGRVIQQCWHRWRQGVSGGEVHECKHRWLPGGKGEVHECKHRWLLGRRGGAPASAALQHGTDARGGWSLQHAVNAWHWCMRRAGDPVQWRCAPPSPTASLPTAAQMRTRPACAPAHRRSGAAPQPTPPVVYYAHDVGEDVAGETRPKGSNLRACVRQRGTQRWGAPGGSRRRWQRGCVRGGGGWEWGVAWGGVCPLPRT